MIPIFSTNNSLGSILSLEPSGKSNKESAPSLFDCARDLGLKDIFVCDNNPASFKILFEKCKSVNLSLRFGLNLKVFSDDKNIEQSWAKYRIFATNGLVIKEKLFPLFSLSQEKYEGYTPIELLKEMSDGLIILSAFYDGFIMNNSMSRDINHIPTLDSYYMEVQDGDLPFDSELQNEVENFARKNKKQILKTKSIFYRQKEECKAFITYKAIKNRTNFSAPNLQYFGSDNFCVEDIK